MYFKTFDSVFAAVEQGLCDYGVLPIENSTYGTVNAVYDLMKNYNFYIIKSFKLHVNHVLLAKPGVKFGDIKEIYSHEQAIGQCSEFLKNIKTIKINICENTAAAAKMTAESDRSDIASISSPNCAQLYGLGVLRDNISDSANNYTRFICISKKLLIFPGADKISIMLTVQHKPGTLYSLISRFAVLGVNLTKLESRPIPGSDFNFMFYFDMDASTYTPSIMALLDELSESPETFVFLGSYSES
jgi:chorismate mutase/prephenate dehydratase